MQYVILCSLLILTGGACRCIRRNPRTYRRFAWMLGLLIAGAMLIQEGVLLRAGLLTWATGLPLHLCSLMGVLTLPMLLTRCRTLVSAALYLGVPGAVLALVFPAVLPTPWPILTAAAFHTLHAGLACAPMLPIALGWRPVPSDTLRAGGILVLAGLIAMLVNPLCGGNYLFLAGPVAGTPLAWLGQWGLLPYRLLLGTLAICTLAAEAGITTLVRKGERPARTLPRDGMDDPSPK